MNKKKWKGRKRFIYLLNKIVLLEKIQQDATKHSWLQKPNEHFHQKPRHPRSYYTTINRIGLNWIEEQHKYIYTKAHNSTEQTFDIGSEIVLIALRSQIDLFCRFIHHSSVSDQPHLSLSQLGGFGEMRWDEMVMFLCSIK